MIIGRETHKMGRKRFINVGITTITILPSLCEECLENLNTNWDNKQEKRPSSLFSNIKIYLYPDLITYSRSLY